MQSKRGFTLIELMVIVAVVAVLATVGLPSFSQFIQEMRLASTANDLHSDLLLARSESIRRNSRVLLCPRASTTSARCATTPAADTWMNGWLVCYDADSDGACDAPTGTDPNPVRVRSGPSSPLKLTGPAASLTFFPVGNASGAAIFTMASGTSSTRSIMVAPSGSVTSNRN